MHLSPLELYRAAQKENKAKLVRYHAEVCTRCGCCTWVCPAHIPLSEKIATGKDLIRQDQEK
jgi:electron transport complex protein RnfC